MSMYFCDIKDDVRFVILRELEDASFDDCDSIWAIRATILDSVVEAAQHLAADEIIEYVQYVILNPQERHEANISLSDFDDDMTVFQIYGVVVKEAFEQVWNYALADFLKGVRND